MCKLILIVHYVTYNFNCNIDSDGLVKLMGIYRCCKSDDVLEMVEKMQ